MQIFVHIKITLTNKFSFEFFFYNFSFAVHLDYLNNNKKKITTIYLVKKHPISILLAGFKKSFIAKLFKYRLENVIKRQWHVFVTISCSIFIVPQKVKRIDVIKNIGFPPELWLHEWVRPRLVSEASYQRVFNYRIAKSLEAI